jgi:hypothetical protein
VLAGLRNALADKAYTPVVVGCWMVTKVEI